MAVSAYKTTATPKEKYIVISNKLTNSDNSKTAKLSQKLMFKLANGSMDITRSALHFMLHTIQFVAKDGRIYTNMDEVKTALNFQTKTLVRVIAELEELGLLSVKDGFFYSHFHVLSNGQKSDETYVRNLKVFTSPTVLNLKKSELRLLLYVASLGVMNGAIKKVAVESLYSNLTHNQGVNYIDSYLNLADILNVLVSNGLIEVFIGEQAFTQKNADKFIPAFHNYCGYKENTRKKRMSKTINHNIGLRVNPALYEDKALITENIASRKEIEYYADQNGFFHEHMRPETIPYIIKVQDGLFERFGLVGVEMYRRALIHYFTTEKENVIYHDLYADENTSKAVNTMMDFFLIPDIIKVITAAVSNRPTEDDVVSYFNTKENVLALLDYFNEKASKNHIILLDEALEEVNVDVNELIHTVDVLNPTENGWFFLQANMKQVYSTVNYSHSVLSENFQKRIVRQWAKEGVFTQKQLLDAAVKALKSKVVFLPKEQYKGAITDFQKETNSQTTTKPSNRKETSEELFERSKQELFEKWDGKDMKDISFGF